MPCPLCRKMVCDHTSEERGETPDEMRRIYERDRDDRPVDPHGPKRNRRRKEGRRAA